MELSKKYGHQFIRIVPPLPCFVCGRLSPIALLGDPGVTAYFQALCPLHGWGFREGPEPTLHELQMDVESVGRFVNWMHDGKASINLVAPVHDIGTIPDYEQYYHPEWLLDLDMVLAWYVCFEMSDGCKQECYVLWSNVESSTGRFYLFADGKEYQDRAIHWIASE